MLRITHHLTFLTIIAILTGACGGAGGDSGGAGKPAAGSGGGGSGGSEAGSGGGNQKPSESDELYDPEKLPRFDIELPEASIAALTDDPTTYVRGTLRYGDETVTEIGVRIKGEGTLRRLDQKPAFKLKFDTFVEKQSFRGLRRITLNNVVEDPTFLAERLAYHMYRTAKLPAPRANNALVYLNGEFLGVYANVENEDKAFLRRWFESDAGNLYEEAEADFEFGREEFFELETNEEKNDRSDLMNLLIVLAQAGQDNYLADIGAALDTDHFLRFTAMEAAVDQWDMYSYSYFYPNNFRVYHDPSTEKFVFLPWGMDLALKPFPYSGRAHIPIFQMAHYADSPDQRISNGLIFRRCLESADCTAKYTEVVRDTAKKFDAAKLDLLAEQYYEQIKEHVYAETRKEISNSDFDAAFQTLLETIRTRTDAIAEELD